MNRKKKVNEKNRKKKGIALLLVAILLVTLGLTLLLLKYPTLFKSRGQTGKIIVLYPNPDIARPNLQLKTFPYIVLPSAPSDVPAAPQSSLPQSSIAPNAPGIQIPQIGQYCPLDDIKPSGNSCPCLDSNAVACPASGGSATVVPSCTSGTFPMQLPPASGKWYCITIGTPGITDPSPPPPPAGCFAACIAKPVVYLYPEKKTLVDVSVDVPGRIFISDPLYPQEGWKNVEAHPDGTLYYQGKRYSELFYESTVTKKIVMPKTGIIIAQADLEPELRRITTQLGLIKNEQQEFLDYWVPILQNLKSPHIFFSVFPPEVKESLDHLTISPEPDTRIEFIAYFKPLQKPLAVEPLVLPTTPPARIGFTEVEWGGTIGE